MTKIVKFFVNHCQLHGQNSPKTLPVSAWVFVPHKCLISGGHQQAKENEGRISGKYGFGGGLDVRMADLPKSRAAPDKATHNEAVGRHSPLGFVSREPIKRKPGPKRNVNRFVFAGSRKGRAGELGRV